MSTQPLAGSAAELPVDTITALRTTQQHHVRLSMMADQKANMLIGAAFVVFTLAIGQSADGGSLALTVLAIAALLAAALATLAVMPATQARRGSPPNMLFFGAFQDIDESAYVDRLIARELSSQDEIVRAMLRDIHQMGRLLGHKKYRYLGWAYRVFLLGLLVSFAAFVWEVVAGPAI